jgi:hypothetical protein
MQGSRIPSDALMYLGQANGSSVLWNPVEGRTVRLPTDTISISYLPDQRRMVILDTNVGASGVDGTSYLEFKARPVLASSGSVAPNTGYLTIELAGANVYGLQFGEFVNGRVQDFRFGRRRINCSLSGHQFGALLKALSTWVERNLPGGNELMVEGVGIDRPMYAFDNGVFLNAEVVRKGLAVASATSPKIEEDQEILSAEREAKKKRMGLWRFCRDLHT